MKCELAYLGFGYCKDVQNKLVGGSIGDDGEGGT